MAMRWQAVSVPASDQPSANSRKVSRASRSEAEPHASGRQRPPSTAAEALDRIELPQEALDRISQMLSPGASLIVSDHGHNREMRAVGHRLHRPDALAGSVAAAERRALALQRLGLRRTMHIAN